MQYYRIHILISGWYYCILHYQPTFIIYVNCKYILHEYVCWHNETNINRFLPSLCIVRSTYVIMLLLILHTRRNRSIVYFHPSCFYDENIYCRIYTSKARFHIGKIRFIRQLYFTYRKCATKIFTSVTFQHQILV